MIECRQQREICLRVTDTKVITILSTTYQHQLVSLDAFIFIVFRDIYCIPNLGAREGDYNARQGQRETGTGREYVYFLLFSYLELYDLLNQCQGGFRPGRSTIDTVAGLLTI